MRREQFSLEVSNVGWLEDDGPPEMPTLTVTYDGDASALRDHLRDAEGDALGAEEVDVSFRLHGRPDDASGEDGVVAVTERVTGDYALEVNGDAEEVLTFVTAARRYAERTDQGVRYRVRIVAEGAEDAVVTYEKRTLLVYSEDGELLRQQSLIPSGVEI